MSPDNTGPIFVLCCARSGSTLLRYILDAHPAIACPPELHLIAMAVRLEWMYQQLLPRQEGATAEELRTAARTRTRADVDRIMSEYCKSRDKEIWAEKSVFTVDMLKSVPELFPEARYLCLYRNGPDVVQSALATLRDDPTGQKFGFMPYLARAPKNPSAALFEYWFAKTMTILRFEGENPDRCLHIQYESLVRNTKSVLTDLSNFCQLEFHTSMVDSAFTVEPGPGDPNIQKTDSIHQDSIGKGAALDLTAVSDERITEFNRLHAELGYAPLTG